MSNCLSFLANSGNFLKTLEIINKFSRFKIRLDFNESITPDQLMNFNESLSSHTRNNIDFIEDPFPYDPDLWFQYQKQTGLNFALDRGPYNANKGFKVRIWKPVILSSVETIQPICITHNMDHEFGRRYAAYCASITNYSIKVHGIGDFNHNRNGYGLGMDDYLESLSSTFHSYWSAAKTNKDLRFLDSENNLSIQMEILLNRFKITLNQGLGILGIDPKSEM